MSLVDVIYRIPAGDQFRPMFATPRQSTSSAAASVTATYTNAEGLPLLVQNVGVLMTGGAAQYPTHLRIIMLTPDGIAVQVAGEQFTLTTAAQSTNWGYPAQLVVPQRWAISAIALFNAGAAANTVTLNAVGFWIPRGTLGLP